MVSSVASVSRVTNSSRRCFSQRSLRRCCAGVSGTLEPVSVMSCPLLPLGSGASLERPTELVEVVVVMGSEAGDPVSQGEATAGGMNADSLPVLGGQGAQHRQHLLAPARESRARLVGVVARILPILGPAHRIERVTDGAADSPWHELARARPQHEDLRLVDGEDGVEADLEELLDVAEVADDLRGRPVLRVRPHGQLALGPAVQRSRELTGSLHETLEERAYGQHLMFLRRYSVARACRRSRW